MWTSDDAVDSVDTAHAFWSIVLNDATWLEDEFARVLAEFSPAARSPRACRAAVLGPRAVRPTAPDPSRPRGRLVPFDEHARERSPPPNSLYTWDGRTPEIAGLLR